VGQIGPEAAEPAQPLDTIQHAPPGFSISLFGEVDPEKEKEEIDGERRKSNRRRRIKRTPWRWGGKGNKGRESEKN
jgi:hypothetical protein